MATTKHGDDDDDDGGVYALAPEPPIPVSPASACSATLTADKRRAVKSYLTDLGPALRAKYGRKPHYTPAQVQETALERALRIDYLCWALRPHCSVPAFESLHAAAGEACDYLAMRAAVGAAFFGGGTEFATPAVVDVIVSGAAPVASEAAGWLAGVDWTVLLNWP